MHRLQSAILMAMAFIGCGNNQGGTEEDATIEDLTTFDDGATVDYDATAEDTATFDDGATEDGDATPGPRIKVADDNPRYFSYGDEVIFLNGAGPWEPYSQPSVDYEHWHEELVAHRGNAIRTTPFWPTHELLPWVQDEDGVFDLDTFNDAFWERMDNVLSDACTRGIYTLLQIWDECGIEYPGNPNRWDASPWNPDNNINYTSADMPDNIPGFYDALPTLQDRPEVFNRQKAFFDKVLEVTNPYAHRIIYILANEYSYSGESLSHQGEWDRWPTYWRDYIKDYNSDFLVADQPINASSSHCNQYLTTCLMDALCMVASSEYFEDVYSALDGSPRPLFFSKNPGSSDLDPSTDSIWKYFCKGAAGCRFHHYWEPPSLLDSIERNEYLVNVVERVPLSQMAPRQDLIGNPDDKYCLAYPGNCYLIYSTTTSADSVTLDLSDVSGDFQVERHDTRTGNVTYEENISGGGSRDISSPEGGPWALFVRRL